MAILLIRHGETAHNAARVVQVPETPLNERGVAQAESLARRLAGEGVAHILSSDLRRAHMTAESLRAATGASLELEASLQERNFGDHRGLAYAEIEVDFLGPDHVPPAGEGWSAFHDRVDAAWKRVVDAVPRHEGHLAVVTHGFVCYSLALRILSLPEGATASMRFGNTSLTIVDDRPPWRVRLLNCTAHLG